MSFKGYVRTISLISAVTIAPVLSQAAVRTTKTCTPGTPTAESYHWNFPREASQLLSGMQADAATIQSHAAKLENFDMTPSMSWESQASQLRTIKSAVNDMGAKLCRLEVIRTAVAPWQRKAINRTAPSVRLMADNVKDAILYLNAHQGDFWTPTNRMYADNLYKQATMVSNSVKNFEEYASARNESRQLGRQLGVHSAS